MRLADILDRLAAVAEELGDIDALIASNAAERVALDRRGADSRLRLVFLASQLRVEVNAAAILAEVEDKP